MQIIHNLFPGGVRKVLTMSYDDGQIFDERLVEIFDKYGIRGTFHLNSGNFGKDEFVKESQVAQLYRNHEVSVHTVTHPFMSYIPDTQMIEEILEDRKTLESICGYPVRGLSYPYGQYSDHIMEVATHCGMEYSRTVHSTNDFHLPDNFMEWNPTTHHNGDLKALWEGFLERHFDAPRLFYIWGHSFEFDRENTWDMIEEFCKMAAGREDIWYATNIEIKSYLDGVKRLVYSADRTCIYNPSAMDVWVTVNGESVCIRGGDIFRI